MTDPALPAEGSTPWYDYATWLDGIAREVSGGEFAPVDHTHTADTAPPGSIFVFSRDPVTGNWPSGYDASGNPTYTAGGSASAATRINARPDIRIIWEGDNPPPDGVATGTGGALPGDRHEIPNA